MKNQRVKRPAFSITTTAAATFVADIIPKKRSGEGIGYYTLSQTLATVIGPLIAIFLSRDGSYNIIFAICTIAMASFLSRRKIELTEEQMKKMKGFKLSNFIETGVIPISFVCLLFYLCYSSIVTFLTVYAKEIQLVDAPGLFFLVFAATVLISRPAVGELFDSKGENLIMYLAIFIFAAGLFWFSSSNYSYKLLLSAALIGLGFGAIQSSAQAIAVKITLPHRLGLANSTF